MEIKYIILGVDNLESAIEFFKKLGFSDKGTISIKEDLNGILIENDVAMTSFILTEDIRGKRPMFILATDDCLREYQQLLSNGVNIKDSPYYLPIGLLAEFDDYSGNEFFILEMRAYGNDEN
jgi:hypothetical protein